MVLGEPVLAAAVAFAFVPGEGVVDGGEGADANVGRAPDAPGGAVAAQEDDMATQDRQGLARLEVPEQATGGALGAVEDELRQLLRHFGRVAEGGDLVVV